MELSQDRLRNGLRIEQDLVLPQLPANPEMRESISIWMFDETGAFGFPRMGIEAEASSWNNRLLQANFAFADGRILNGAGRGPAPCGADGRATVLGAGPIVFRCVEPFRRWTIHFDGTAIDGHVSDQIAGTLEPGRRTHVRMDAEMTMLTPAWIQATDEQEASLEASLMGLGYR